VKSLLLIVVASLALSIQPAQPRVAEPCAVSQPTAEFSVTHVLGVPELSTNPEADVWKGANATRIVRDCSRKADYPDLATEVRGFWTDTDVYFLFVCPYRSLNVFRPTQHDRPRRSLWDRDVVELFLGDDWTNIRHYREFEIAPTGDWIDLAIDLDRRGPGPAWSSGWTTAARIDERAKTWYAAARIPLRSVSEQAVVAGGRWRANLYRIDGEGPDSVRRFLCWQPTCVINRDPNHVPEHFGTLTFVK
jgi:hypothetical protein